MYVKNARIASDSSAILRHENIPRKLREIPITTSVTQGISEERKCRQFMRQITAAILILVFASSPLLAVGGKKAEYVGGTITTVPEKTEGDLDTKHETALRFTSKKGSIEIPYAAMMGLEYGQKAGRRVAVAVLVSPLALFSKKRKHFLTVTYKDAQDKEQAAVFELGKDISRTTLTIVSTRSGKEIEYQDEEARKAGRGGN